MVGQDAVVLQLPDHVVKDRLLPVRAVQVAVGQVVPLTDERQRLRRLQVEVLGPALALAVAVEHRVEARVWAS